MADFSHFLEKLERSFWKPCVSPLVLDHFATTLTTLNTGCHARAVLRECWDGGSVLFKDTFVDPPEILGTNRRINCNGVWHDAEFPGNGNRYPRTSWDSSCTFMCEPGLWARLHLISAVWNVGLHSTWRLSGSSCAHLWTSLPRICFSATWMKKVRKPHQSA